ncbi:MAG: hypothetical protein CW716_09560 [Candidatus Bathyarchaeum sp.]|nr:MAG: hypothetical protein CW716_09560 [Candidatus Bathyarchaeum sp.]
MKKFSILRSNYAKSEVARSKSWFAVFMLLLVVSAVVVAPVVLAQINLDVDADFEMEFTITSTTVLWEAGTHSFEVTGEGNFTSPIEDTFTMNGSGTVTYTMVGGGPPGEFDVTLEMSGNIEDSVLAGPYTLTVVGHATTALVATTPGYERTEEVMNAAINGTFNELPWNATSTSTMVDFSVVEGTEFQIRVTGSSTIIPEFPTAIAMPVILIAVTLAAAIITGAYTKKGRSTRQ